MIFAGLGYWLDGKLGWSPILTVTLSVFGFVGAMVSLIYRVQQTEESDKKR